MVDFKPPFPRKRRFNSASRGPRCLTLSLPLLLVCGCAGMSEVSVSSSATHAATPPGDCRGKHSSYTVKGQRYWVRALPPGHSEQGLASWYGKRFHGRKTASGEIFDMRQVSAAHKTLPLYSIVRVTNLNNGKQITVRINDRGPFVPKRLIDLSYTAAKELGMVDAGVVPVRVTVVEMPGSHKVYAALTDLIDIHRQ